jgi:hypothetical protein
LSQIQVEIESIVKVPKTIWLFDIIAFTFELNSQELEN